MPLNASNAHGLVLSRVIPNGHWFFRDKEVRVTSCCTQADRCQPGDLFAALDEDETASQEAVELAIARGATAILCERPLPNMIPQYVVDDGRVAVGQLAHALSGQPCQSLRTLAVAGTYGKSTTAKLLTSILQADEQTAASYDTSSLGDHGSLRLASWLGEQRSLGIRNTVLEAASRPLARKQFVGTELDAIVINNVTRDFRRGDHALRNYQKSILSILDYRKPDGFVVLNADDPVCQSVIQTLDAPALTIGMNNQADVSARIIERHASEQTFVVNAGSESVVVRTKMIGDGHIYNCMASVAVGLVLGIDPTQVVRGIESVEAMHGRMERIECGQSFGVYVEQCATPTSLSYALSTLRSVSQRKVFCLLGVDEEVPKIGRARLGRTIEKFADRCVLTGTRLDQKMSLRTGHDVLDGFDRPAQANLMPDRAKAICWMLSEAKPGDMIIVAGGTPSPGPDGIVLSDTDVAEYWLRHVHQPSDCPWQPA